jgi:hypothetical protein
MDLDGQIANIVLNSFTIEEVRFCLRHLPIQDHQMEDEKRMFGSTPIFHPPPFGGS